MSQSTLAALKSDLQKPAVPEVAISFDTVPGFEGLQRIAKLFATSDIVPKQYQGNLPNCAIAVDMALRMNANPLMVCQNLYIVHGNPAWSAQFLIATFNKSGRFSSLRYEFQGKEGEDDWGCRAGATELATGEKLVGPLITIKMAKDSGWYSKKDKYGNETSKWQTMPEMMLRYRAAAWFVRAYAPEIAMGLQTAEEVRDSIIDVTPEWNNSVVMEDLQSLPSSKPVQAEDIVQEAAWETTQNANPQYEQHEEQTPSNAKKAADRQRAARAAGKRKPSGTGQAELDATPTLSANGNAQRADVATVDGQVDSSNPEAIAQDMRCPNDHPDGSPRMVSEGDCMNCHERDGCPNWNEEF